MSLKDLADEYIQSARPLQNRLWELRQLVKMTEDPEEVWRIKRRIAELTPQLTNCLKMAEFCERYYDRDFYIKGGVWVDRSYTSRQREEISKAYADYGFGIDTHPGVHLTGGSIRRTDNEKLSGGKKSKYFNRLADLCKG